MTTLDLHENCRTRPIKWALSFLVALTVLAGCAPVRFETGRKFETSVLEQSLRTGESTQNEVRQTLGEPSGTGRALLPFHESPRTLWTYSFQRGSINLGNGESEVEMVLLFVFFAEDRYDGYIWGSAKMESNEPK